MKTTILSHNFLSSAPNINNLKFGEVAIFYHPTHFDLFSKDINGQIVQIGKGVKKLEELEDVNISNPKNNQFLVRQNGKWVNSSYIADFSNISGVEISNPIAGQTLIWEPGKEAFVNGNFSFRFSELTDVVINPSGTDKIKVVAYNPTSQIFSLEDVPTRISDFEDVVVNPSPPGMPQVMATLDSGQTWRNLDFDISWDKSPTLGGDLNANFFAIKTLGIEEALLIFLYLNILFLMKKLIIGS